MAESQVFPEGLTFDDVLLVPNLSEVLPANIDITTQLTSRVRGHRHRGTYGHRSCS